MPKHNISFVKASETTKNDVMNVGTNDEHPYPIPHITHVNPMDEMVDVIDDIPHKGQPKKSLYIAFSSKDIIKHIPNGPLYIANCIYGKPTNGILIDPTYGDNVIIEELLVLNDLYQDDYDKPKAWINMHNGFSFPTIGLNTLPLQIGPTTLDVTFTIIPQSDQFLLRLVHPWLHSMKIFPSIIHKCLNFSFEKEIFIVHHRGFNSLPSKGNFSLESFWLEPMEPITPQQEFFFIAYQKFNENKIA